MLNQKKILNPEAQSIKRKLNALAEMIGKDKLRTINYALDLTISYIQGKLNLNKILSEVYASKLEKNFRRKQIIKEYLAGVNASYYRKNKTRLNKKRQENRIKNYGAN